MSFSFTNKYFKETLESISNIDVSVIDKMAKTLSKVRLNKGRVFFLGVGGSAANCSHAVNDFRKLCNIECYCPTDNVSELTARTNDEGWEYFYEEWLKVSRLNSKDLLFFMSVGGGNLKRKVSVNLIRASIYAKKRNAKMIGIYGKKNSYLSKVSNLEITVLKNTSDLVTPISESIQSVIWHCLVSHPLLKKNATKW
jgi:D-sedoheptulose 7-phosphate isomerase